MAERQVYGEGPVDFVSIKCEDKIPLIKAVRTITGCGLKEAKDAVEGILRSIVVEFERIEECNLGHKHETKTSYRLDSQVNSHGTQIVRFPSADFLDAVPVLWNMA